MSFSTLKEILEVSEARQVPFWETVLLDDMKERGVEREVSFETMRGMYQAMRLADVDYDADLRSASGLAGGDGAKLESFRHKGNRLIGDFLTKVMEKAVKMGESNACMKLAISAKK